MIFKKNKIKGSYLIKTKKIGDDRGYFSRVFCKKIFKKFKISNSINQANHSFSKTRGTIRGMHFQLSPSDEMKLIICTKGKYLM